MASTSSSSNSALQSSTLTVLGKRKATHRSGGPDIDYVLHLVSSSEPTADEFESEHSECLEYEASASKKNVASVASISTSKPILVNGKLQFPTSSTKKQKRYACRWDGCDKAYTKPSRLEEHERSHTGFRPFNCAKCNKSYLRESHLQAHNRIHLPESDKPFACPEGSCVKRFWTYQHLKVHLKGVHGGQREREFVCDEPDCTESFVKHHQLRTHKCTIHAPPGTKPYQCNHPGCTKSFKTNQHLRTHSKVHNEKRYTCAHPSCLPRPDISDTSTADEPSSDSRRFFPTWSALQHHTRTAHPPTCPHIECRGKKFSTQKGLRAHLKLHEEREVEGELYAHAHEGGGEFDDDAPDEDGDGRLGDTRSRKKRRGGDVVGRDWKCGFEGCGKEFKSNNALSTHHKVTHLGRRDFVCIHEGCGRAYGYKHLLQRHSAKAHAAPPLGDISDSEPKAKRKQKIDMSINAITGVTYAQQAKEKLGRFKALKCPFPRLEGMGITDTAVTMVEGSSADGRGRGRDYECDYVFSRAYDLRRHLRAGHAVEVDRVRVEEWVDGQK
ncbi:hypothetical protein L218DRAFT_892168, partial [Marasmius fiardii PR-910]